MSRISFQLFLGGAMGRAREGSLKQMWGNTHNCDWKMAVWYLGFLSPRTPRNRHPDRFKGCILLEEIAMRKEIVKGPERLRESHFKCKSDPK